MSGMTQRPARSFQDWRGVWGKSGKQEKPFCALRVAMPLTRRAMDAEEKSKQLERDGKKFEMEESSMENVKLTWQFGSSNIKSSRDGKIEGSCKAELGLFEKAEGTRNPQDWLTEARWRGNSNRACQVENR